MTDAFKSRATPLTAKEETPTESGAFVALLDEYLGRTLDDAGAAQMLRMFCDLSDRDTRGTKHRKELAESNDRLLSIIADLRRRPPASPPSASEITEALNQYDKAAYADRNGIYTRSWESTLTAARSRLETLYREQLQEIERLRVRSERETKAMNKMFGEVCEPLHDCCQRHKLGLGGEHVQRLVVEEVDRLFAENQRFARWITGGGAFEESFAEIESAALRALSTKGAPEK